LPWDCMPARGPGPVLTGVRISIGASWLLSVAAERLVGCTRIGYYECAE
jgi:ABC-type nitrate/sulfonate/bicarbonate transport system permease component